MNRQQASPGQPQVPQSSQQPMKAEAKGSKSGGRLALIFVLAVLLFVILTHRMMATNEASTAIEDLSEKFLEKLHKNHGDAIEAASTKSSSDPPPRKPAAVAAPKWKPTNQSLSDLLADYTESSSSSSSSSGSRRKDTGMAAGSGVGGEAGGARLRGQKVKQQDLVAEEKRTKGAARGEKSAPPPPSPAKSKPKPKAKPAPKPTSPLDSLPQPPNPGYHPLISPRPGTDISAENRLSVLRCQNQTKCVVPQLQLEAKLKIYFCRHPARHGVRFYYLVREGLHLHPNVQLLPYEKIDEADFVVYLPGSSPWHLTECTNASLHTKLLVLDEFDGYNMFHPFERIEQVEAVYGKSLMWYFMYFKRSFVARREGKFLSHPHLSQPDVYPITYAVADAYVNHNFNFQRSIDVLCTLRGSSKMVTRMRAQEWVSEYAKSRSIENAITEQINSATRTTLSQGYFQQMYNAKIIVTVNPANWEGDFRLWESMATGALVFVDPIFVPHGFPLVDGEHVVYFSNVNKSDLFSKLDHYRAHPEEATRIAQNGYLHVMKHHRTVSLIDYVLRSAHLKRSKLLHQLPLPKYKYTAQFLNHQTLAQTHEIKKQDKPGAYHHAHLDHHDHSLVKHHHAHHHIIHKHSKKTAAAAATAGAGVGASNVGGAGEAAAKMGKNKVFKSALEQAYPSLRQASR